MGTREAGWETAAASEYTKRLAQGALPVQTRTSFYADSDMLGREVVGLGPPLVVLDEGGTQLTSAEFGELIFGRLFRASPRISFVIGGADGLPGILRRPSFA